MIARFGEWLGFVVLTAIAALVLGEVAVRIHSGHPFWPIVPPKPYVDPELFYVRSATRLYDLRPNQDEVIGYGYTRIAVNRAGFRDDVDPVVPKPAGTWRAIVLGDSFTFSGKVQLADTFSKQLQRLLGMRDASRRYEVLNLGVPGYKSGQELDQLREKGLGLEPDVVIVDYTLNGAAPPVQLIPTKRSRWPAWIKRFDLVQFLYGNWKRYAFLRQGSFFPSGESHSDLVEGSARWESSKADLREMKRICAEKGIELLVVMWPVFLDLGADYPYAAKHRLVVEACEALSIPVVDLLPAFQGSDATMLWVSRDDHHPNPQAQSRVAEVVAAALEEKRMLPSPVAIAGHVEAGGGGRGLAR